MIWSTKLYSWSRRDRIEGKFKKVDVLLYYTKNEITVEECV